MLHDDTKSIDNTSEAYLGEILVNRGFLLQALRSPACRQILRTKIHDMCGSNWALYAVPNTFSLKEIRARQLKVIWALPHAAKMPRSYF